MTPLYSPEEVVLKLIEVAEDNWTLSSGDLFRLRCDIVRNALNIAYLNARREAQEAKGGSNGNKNRAG